MEDVHQKSMKHGEKFEVAIEIDVGVKMTPLLVIMCSLARHFDG